jgi:hypothetical protein
VFAVTPFQRRQPGCDEAVVIARPEETSRGAEEALRLFAPANPLATANSRLDQRLVLHHHHRDLKPALHVNGTIGLGEYHRLFGQQSESTAVRVIWEITGRCLMRQPLPRIALGDIRLCRQLARRHRPICIQRLIEPQPVTDARQGYTKRPAEIAEYPADKFAKLGLVHHRRLRYGSEIITIGQNLYFSFLPLAFSKK